MRLLLESFRLPGEAQQIDRIIQHFAHAFFEATRNTQYQDEIADEDAAYLLAFSIIMLNTDLYNPQVRRRMSKEEYKRNVRGGNKGRDFDPAYLDAMYDALKESEIVMPEEHEGDLGFNYAWQELMKKMDSAGPIILNIPKSVFEKDMFSTIWIPLVAAISYGNNIVLKLLLLIQIYLCFSF